jgi:hypothetical protein
MAVWKNRDGVATHLKHTANMGGSHSGGSTGCSGGEGDDHSRWKGLAADALEDAFNDIGDIDGFSEETKKELVKEKGVSAPVSDKERRVGDVVLTFTERDWQFGDGLIVEVQDKNKSKNRTLTTQDYVEQGFAVVWLYEDDFIQTQSDESPGKCRLGEVEFRHRARQATHKYVPVEKQITYKPYDVYCSNPFHPSFITEPDADRDVTIPAKIPDEYFAEQQRRYWMRQPWHSRFRDEVTSDTEKAYRLRAAIGSGTVTRQTATLPPECIDTMIYNRLDWDSIESVGYPKTLKSPPCQNRRVQATLPPGCSKQIIENLHHMITTPDELRERACTYGWEQESGRSPYHNLKNALELTSTHSCTRKIVLAFAAIHIRGLGGEKTTQRALDKMADDDDCQTPLSTLSITAD